MKNFYQALHKVIGDELYAREATLDAQREGVVMAEEATEITKDVIGTVLESIERNWKA